MVIRLCSARLNIPFNNIIKKVDTLVKKDVQPKNYELICDQNRVGGEQLSQTTLGDYIINKHSVDERDYPYAKNLRGLRTDEKVTPPVEDHGEEPTLELEE